MLKTPLVILRPTGRWTRQHSYILNRPVTAELAVTLGAKIVVLNLMFLEFFHRAPSQVTVLVVAFVVPVAHGHHVLIAGVWIVEPSWTACALEIRHAMTGRVTVVVPRFLPSGERLATGITLKKAVLGHFCGPGSLRRLALAFVLKIPTLEIGGSGSLRRVGKRSGESPRS